MSRRHTTGFSVLGMDRDPTPGDPDQIDQLARFYEEIRDDAQTGVRVLGRGTGLPDLRPGAARPADPHRHGDGPGH
jgi:hypothetical protein